MTPRTAAGSFVQRVLSRLADDVLDLSEHNGRAYQRIRTAVRRRLRLRACDLGQLQRTIIVAVPQEHRARVQRALETYVKAETDEQAISQQAAYAVGVAVGRSLAGSVAETLGDGCRGRTRKAGAR